MKMISLGGKWHLKCLIIPVAGKKKEKLIGSEKVGSLAAEGHNKNTIMMMTRKKGTAAVEGRCCLRRITSLEESTHRKMILLQEKEKG
mmetsp:Transcript_36357/g.63391  ORF Transcript_36357/g.63391 Transcript_36357/m.63391 type:complete len:88 (+) Transcript_36357:524-787(+)